MQHDREWTRDLLQQIKTQGSYSKVADTYKEKYRQDDVKDALVEMYSGSCCYCESRIGHANYEHIEHYRPRNKFPGQCYCWRNLHIVCDPCNRSKSDKWDDNAPIPDPCTEDLGDHVEYLFADARAKTNKGVTLIEHAKLNREKLRKRREDVAKEAVRLIQELLHEGNDANKQYLKQKLSQMNESGMEFVTMIEGFVKDFLPDGA